MEYWLKTLLSGFNETFTFFFVFPTMIFLGLYLTFKLKFVQVSQLKKSFSCLFKKSDSFEGNITHYQAISAVLAGNFGTGNISGMAVALATGGPGALVWMWVAAFLGAAIQYASCVLGIKYRKVNESNEYVGGPMHYLREGLGMKKMGIAFSIFAIIAALTVGNFAQVNSVTLPLQKIGIPPLLCGFGIAMLTAFVILGGMQRFAKVASSIVPVMAILYLGTALFILSLNVEKIVPAFLLMLKCAFNPPAVFGGALGFGFIKALSTGFDRGIFATDAGTGIVPMIQSSAKTETAVMNGIATLIAPVLVMIVCTATALVLIVTGAWQVPDLFSTNMVTYAFQKGLSSDLGAYVVTTALFLFAFTTVLAWACCGEKAVGFIFGKKGIRPFQYIYIALIPLGAVLHVDLIWMFADASISLMLATNMVGIIGLIKHVIRESREFFLENT